MKIRALVSIDKSSLPCSKNLFLRLYGRPWVSTAMVPLLLIGSLPRQPFFTQGC